MREAAFIKQNKQKWLDFERQIYAKENSNPDELSKLYIHLVNDLSYAQTFYPKSKTILYLIVWLQNRFKKFIEPKKRIQTNSFIFLKRKFLY